MTPSGDVMTQSRSVMTLSGAFVCTFATTPGGKKVRLCDFGVHPFGGLFKHLRSRRGPAGSLEWAWGSYWH